MAGSNKSTINVLMNIDNYFGEHKGSLGTTMKFLLASAAPFIFYVISLSRIVPISYALVFELFWTARMAMVILGKEKERVAKYLESANDEYSSANDLVRISNIREDGLVEYVNSKVAYVISGYFMSYMDDDSLSIDLQAFLEQLKGYKYDIYCDAVVDEFKLQDSLYKMRVYTDKELMQERMLFYMKQDDYCSNNTKLYKINIVVKCLRYDWKKMKARLEEVLKSEYAKVFKSIKICDEQEVNDVISRDICTNVDINRMLISKHSNDSYYGSKVLFYGDEVPEEYRPKKDKVNLEDRRVILNGKGYSGE